MEESLQGSQEDTLTSAKSKMPVGLIIVVLLVVTGVWLYATSRGSSTPSTTSTTPSEQSLPTSESIRTSDGAKTIIEERDNVFVMQGDVKVFTLEASSYKYAPDFIGVQKGDRVKIILKSTDMMHDFNVDELGLSIPVTKSGSTNEVVFTADEAGEFEFYCSVGDHRQKGQVGTLVVIEQTGP